MAPEEIFEEISEKGAPAAPVGDDGAAASESQTPLVAVGAPFDRVALHADLMAKRGMVRVGPPTASATRHPSSVSSSLICRRCGAGDHVVEGCSA